MAKGFKVVTTPPEKGGKSADEGEYTIDKARELVKGKTFIFCLQIGRGRVGKECRSRWSPYH